MGCVSTKDHHIKQFNIKLPDSINQNTLQTDADLSDSQDQFLQIGMNVTSLGKLNPKVEEIHSQLGELFADIQGQYLIMPDESIFFGETCNSKRHGVGKQHWPKEGNLLEGTWIENQLNGKARMIYPNGDYFEGQFLNNIANGKGMFCNNKKKVIGFWQNNKLNGEGKEIRKNGTVYIGQFLDGKLQGIGQYKFANGCGYYGGISKGKMHGRGELKFPDGTTYQGEFKNNCIQGKGIYSGKNTYAGWFHSKYDNSTLHLFFFSTETPVMLTTEGCILIQIPISQSFE